MNRRRFLGMALAAPVVAKFAPLLPKSPSIPQEVFTYRINRGPGYDYVDLSLWRTDDYGKTWHLVESSRSEFPRMRLIDDEAISEG